MHLDVWKKSPWRGKRRCPPLDFIYLSENDHHDNVIFPTKINKELKRIHVKPAGVAQHPLFVDHLSSYSFEGQIHPNLFGWTASCSICGNMEGDSCWNTFRLFEPLISQWVRYHSHVIRQKQTALDKWRFLGVQHAQTNLSSANVPPTWQVIKDMVTTPVSDCGVKCSTLRIIGPSKLVILRTLPLLYRFKPFHWRVQDP